MASTRQAIENENALAEADKRNGFTPFHYAQEVMFFEPAGDVSGDGGGSWQRGKIEGVVQGEKGKLLIVRDGKSFRVSKKNIREFTVDDVVAPTPQQKLYYDKDKKFIVYEGDRVRYFYGADNLSKVGTIKEHIGYLVGVQFDGESSVLCLRPDQLTLEARSEAVQREAYAEAEDDVLRGRASPSILKPPQKATDVPLQTPLETMGHSGLDPITKDTNPKDALAGFKPRWFSFLPLQVLIGVGKAMFEGGWKYGKHNYRDSGVRASVYVDAAVCGHLMPWMEGQDCDENGMHHIEKAIASLMVLRDAQINGNWIDDRPLRAENFEAHMAAETEHFQAMKAELQRKFGDPVAPYTEKGRGQPRAK